MSNYRVRQVLALGDMPERQLRFLIALASWLPDDTRSVKAGFSTLIETSGRSHNTIRKARRELEAAGKLTSITGRGRGNLTVWVLHCLPEKGTNDTGTLSPDGGKGTNDAGTVPRTGNGGKGTNRGSEKVPTRGQKRYQPQLDDQQEPERGLDLRAKPPGLSARGAAGNGHQVKDPEAVGQLISKTRRDLAARAAQ